MRILIFALHGVWRTNAYVMSLMCIHHERTTDGRISQARPSHTHTRRNSCMCLGLITHFILARASVQRARAESESPFVFHLAHLVSASRPRSRSRPSQSKSHSFLRLHLVLVLCAALSWLSSLVRVRAHSIRHSSTVEPRISVSASPSRCFCCCSSVCAWRLLTDFFIFHFIHVVVSFF